MDILINVTNKIAETQGAPVMVCGNSDYNVVFTFDAEWEGLDPKLARFVFTADGKLEYIDVPFTGDTVQAPVLSNIDEVYVGVYAGELHTTTPARVYCKKSILCGDPVAVEPDPSLYGPVLDVINEVIAARTSAFSGVTFASLASRLNAEFSGCVRQGDFERAMASFAAADNMTASRLTQLETDMENLQAAEGTIMEVVDARTSAFSGVTFASLASRLNAEFSGCVRQGDFERAVAGLTGNISIINGTLDTLTDKVDTHGADIDALEIDMKYNSADIKALKTSVLNLQDNGVKTAATAGEALNKANAALGAITHTHDNKNVLDAITIDTLTTITTTQQKAQENAANIDALTNSVAGISNTATEALNKADACLDAAHGHDNKNVLDSVTSAAIASWTATATKADQNAETIEAIRPIVMANQTDVNALKSSVQNLQDNGVKTAATAGEALNKANAALSGLSRDAALCQSTTGTAPKKNLLKNRATTTTKNGVTFTVNDDGSVTVNGTATADTELVIRNLTLEQGRDYILTGCPVGGSGGTYRMYAMDTTTWGIRGADYGSGFTLNTDAYRGWTIRIQIKSGYTSNDVVFQPMLRYAEIEDGTFEPYTPSLQEQIDELRTAIEAMGATTTTEV